MAVKTQSEKTKLKRARSWAKNQAAKILRKEEQARREQHNRDVGSTGKQRANAARKLERFEAKRATTPGTYAEALAAEMDEGE